MIGKTVSRKLAVTGTEMIKLLLSSAFIAPCIILPLIGSANTSNMAFTTPSFEDTYIEPEFKQLENCRAAELDVYFHEDYVTMHSAEYVADGIKRAEDCKNATYTITPIIPTTSYADEDTILNTRMSELTLILEAHGVEAVIGNSVVQQDYDSLSANGRTAKIKISFKQSDTA